MTLMHPVVCIDERSEGLRSYFTRSNSGMDCRANIEVKQRRGCVSGRVTGQRLASSSGAEIVGSFRRSKTRSHYLQFKI